MKTDRDYMRDLLLIKMAIALAVLFSDEEDEEHNVIATGLIDSVSALERTMLPESLKKG